MAALHTKLTEKLIPELGKAVKEDVMWALEQVKLKNCPKRHSNK